MDAAEAAVLRTKLRRLLRVARFEAWSLDAIEDEIEGLFREGVIDQPPAPPDQRPGPP